MSETQGMIVRPQAGAGAQIARQGFGEQALERRDSASTAMAERARAEVQARRIMAIQAPRTLDAVRVRVLDHCKRPRFAEKARYSKPVGGQKIEGPSIRFVEAALVEFGNVMMDCAVSFEDDERVTIRVSVTDLERNITHDDEATIMKRMERKRLRDGQRALGQRTNSRGEVVFIVETSDDDVANMKASRQSKILRNLGLRILPADIVEEAMDLCVSTLEKGDAQDPAAARKRLVDTFHAIGVSPQDLAGYLGHPLEQVTAPELADLRAVFAAIRDGETTWRDTMAARHPVAEEKPAAAPPPAKGVEGAKAKLAAKRKVEPAPPSPAPTQAPKEQADQPGEVDELELEMRRLRKGLENVFTQPSTLPALRDRIARLPDGVEKASLNSLAMTAARQLAEQDADDDVAGGGEG